MNAVATLPNCLVDLLSTATVCLKYEFQKPMIRWVHIQLF